MCVFFFFKQKTAYEMRISDWSSDVCSSDLGLFVNVGQESVQLGWNAGTNTLTGTGPRGALFTVELTNPATGAYKVTLLDNVLHAPGGDENDAAATLIFAVTDSDGSTANGTLPLAFADDAPTVIASGAQPVLTVDESVHGTAAPASLASVFTPPLGPAAPPPPT